MVVARGRTAGPIKCMEGAEDALPRCRMDQQSYGGTAHYDTLRRIVKEAGCNQTGGGTSHAGKIAVLCADSAHGCEVSLLGESPARGTSLGGGLLSVELEVQSGVDYGEAWRSSCGREGAAGPRSARVGWLQSSSRFWHVNMWEALLLHATAQLYHQVCVSVSPPLSPCIAPAEVLLF